MEETVPRFGYWKTMVVNFVVVLAVSIGTYWLFVDPEWGVISKTYPQPWFIVFFWAILVLAWFFFIGAGWPFSKLKQPWCGITAVAGIAAVVALVIWFITVIFGRWDPTFAWAAPGAAGQTAASFIVLVGFVMYNMWMVMGGFYPFSDWGLKQPGLNLVMWLWGTIWTALIYMLLFYPHFAPWAVAAPLTSFPFAVGWYYACLEIFLFVGLTWENWPHTIFKKRWQVWVASFVGFWVLGTALYYIVYWALDTFLLTAAVKADIGPMLPLYVAEFLVFWSLLVIFWFCYIPTKQFPYKYSPAVNRILRLAIWLVVPTLMFYGYYYWFAGTVLHEPAIGVGGFHGDALGFADYFILINLIWFSCFGNLGLFKKVKAS